VDRLRAHSSGKSQRAKRTGMPFPEHLLRAAFFTDRVFLCELLNDLLRQPIESTQLSQVDVRLCPVFRPVKDCHNIIKSYQFGIKADKNALVVRYSASSVPLDADFVLFYTAFKSSTQCFTTIIKIRGLQGTGHRALLKPVVSQPEIILSLTCLLTIIMSKEDKSGADIHDQLRFHESHVTCQMVEERG
jgi:hypothetical protein